MNQFRVCDRCKGTNLEALIPRLKEIDSKAEIIKGCQNFCAIGAVKSFVICNHIPIVADNEDELIDKIKEKLKEQ